MRIMKICIIAAVWAVLITAGSSADPQKRRPVSFPLPEIKKDCAQCHLAAGTQKGGELRKKVPALCLDCHPDRMAPAEHKVDIVPPMKVKGLPLTDGKMTCSTCHDMHQNTHGSLLRMKATDLCLVCHPV